MWFLLPVAIALSLLADSLTMSEHQRWSMTMNDQAEAALDRYLRQFSKDDRETRAWRYQQLLIAAAELRREIGQQLLEDPLNDQELGRRIAFMNAYRGVLSMRLRRMGFSFGSDDAFLDRAIAFYEARRRNPDGDPEDFGSVPA